MAIPFVTTPSLGINLASVFTPSTTGYPYPGQLGIAVGTMVTATNGSRWIRCLVGAGGVTGLGSVVVMDSAYNVTMFSNAAAAAVLGNRIGVAVAAASAGDYVWVQVYGSADTIAAATGTAANTALTSTATAGQLGTGGTHTISVGGLVLTAVAAANVAPGELNDPVVAT